MWACSLKIVNLNSKQAHIVKENSAIWQQLKQPTAWVGRCWHPKKTVPRSNNSGISQQRYKVWGGQTPGCLFHFCKSPQELKTAHMSRAGKQSLSVFSVYLTGNQMNVEKGRQALCWWETACLFSVPLTITSGWLRRYVESSSPPRQTLHLFISQNNHTEKHAEWVVQKVTPK